VNGGLVEADVASRRTSRRQRTRDGRDSNPLIV